MTCTGSIADTDCGSDDDLTSSSGEVASCVHSMYGCCPDGVTARLADDDDACLTSTTTTNTSSTSVHSSTSDHVTSPTTTVERVTSSFQTTAADMSTTAVETSSTTLTDPTTAVVTTTRRVLSSSDHRGWMDEGDGPVTSLATDREPAYSTTSSPSDDVTTVITAQPTPDVDIIRRGEYWNILQGRHKRNVLGV